MLNPLMNLGRSAFAMTLGASLLFLGFEGESVNGSTTALSSRQSSASSVPGLLVSNDQMWSPEGLEDILAPVALYPDEVIGHVLVAATNPQEVLDAGNWRTQYSNLNGTALDTAAKTAGFSPPVRLLLQNPIVLDMMCSEFGWTQEVGQAFVNDQAAVLDAVQRLRYQARNAGSLQTSDHMVVATEFQGGHEAITISSPDPNNVYVPQYNPEKVYVVQEDDDDDGGVSTTTVVLTSLLAFGGGLALGSLFGDDDDDWDDDDYYRPVYYGAPMPYYAHRPYRPVYQGYYPATGYMRPAGYPYSYSNTTIINRGVDPYWNRYDDRAYSRTANRAVRSPITRARPVRPELNELNAKAKRGPERRAPGVDAERARYDVAKKESAVRAEKRKTATTEGRGTGGSAVGTGTNAKTGKAGSPKTRPAGGAAATGTNAKTGKAGSPKTRPAGGASATGTNAKTGKAGSPKTRPASATGTNAKTGKAGSPKTRPAGGASATGTTAKTGSAGSPKTRPAGGGAGTKAGAGGAGEKAGASGAADGGAAKGSGGKAKTGKQKAKPKGNAGAKSKAGRGN